MTAIPQWWPRLVNMDDAVNLPTRKTSWNGWKPCHSVIFLWMVTERDGEKKTGGKENVHSLKGDEETYMAMELPKTSKQAWKHCPRRHCILRRRMRRMFVSCFFFFKAPQRGDISRNCCYLYIHSLLFQSMINRWKSLVKGGVDLDLLSLSTSPHPTPPFCALPRLLDSSLPLNPSLLWTEPRSSHVGRVRTCL